MINTLKVLWDPLREGTIEMKNIMLYVIIVVDFKSDVALRILYWTKHWFPLFTHFPCTGNSFIWKVLIQDFLGSIGFNCSLRVTSHVQASSFWLVSGYIYFLLCNFLVSVKFLFILHLVLLTSKCFDLLMFTTVIFSLKDQKRVV